MSLIALRRSTLTTLVAAVQLALPVALSVAHAANAGTGLGAPTHVEATSGSQCDTTHVDACIICRHLSTGAAKSPASPSIAANPAMARPASASAITCRSLSRHALQSRAPPEHLA